MEDEIVTAMTKVSKEALIAKYFALTEDKYFLAARKVSYFQEGLLPMLWKHVRAIAIFVSRRHDSGNEKIADYPTDLIIEGERFEVNPCFGGYNVNAIEQLTELLDMFCKDVQARGGLWESHLFVTEEGDNVFFNVVFVQFRSF